MNVGGKRGLCGVNLRCVNGTCGGAWMGVVQTLEDVLVDTSREVKSKVYLSGKVIDERAN